MFDVKRMGKQIAHLRTGSSYTQEHLRQSVNGKMEKLYQRYLYFADYLNSFIAL